VAEPPKAEAPPMPTTTTALARLDSDAFALGLEPHGIEAAYRLAATLAKAGIGGVKSPDEGLARILAGRELGVPAMTSMRQLFSVDGRIGMEATLMHALCLRRTDLCEYFEHQETTLEKATFVAKRRGRPEKVHSFTAEDAERAGMLHRGANKEKNNYDRWLKQMLEARCKAQLARLVFPDIMGGIYTRDEIVDGAVDDPPPPVQVEVDAKVVSAAARDVDAEFTAFQEKANQAKTKQDFGDLRKMIESAGWPEGMKSQAAEIYTASMRRAKETAAAAKAPEAAREPGID
jgi:hypothetical protein